MPSDRLTVSMAVAILQVQGPVLEALGAEALALVEHAQAERAHARSCHEGTLCRADLDLLDAKGAQLKAVRAQRERVLADAIAKLVEAANA